MKFKSRVLSLILAFSILLSSAFCNSVFSLASEKTYTPWNGTSDGDLEGSGTEADPYLISTPEQFNYAIRCNKDEHYKLTADIYLNDLSKIDWLTGEPDEGYTPTEWIPAENARGYFNGNGHIVYGLYINQHPANDKYIESASKAVDRFGSGLVSRNTNGKTLQFDNFGLDYIYIDAPHEVSPFVSHQNSGTMNFHSCFVGQNVHLEGYAVGGFIAYGSNSKIEIEDCYCIIPTENVTVHDGKLYGAFLGNTWNSSNKPNIRYNFCVGRLYGNNNPNSTNCSYATIQKASGWGTIITESEMKGAKALENMSLLHTEKFTTTDSFPQLLVFANVDKVCINCHITEDEVIDLYVGKNEIISELKLPTRKNYKIAGIYYDSDFLESATLTDFVSEHTDIYIKWDELDKNASVWNGAESEPTADADSDGYIDITYPSELAWVIANDAEGKYELLNDICLNDISVLPGLKTYSNNAEDAPIEWYIKGDKAFSGEINGNGHIVRGLFYDGSITEGEAAGLIPSVYKAVVKNIGIEDSYIKGSSDYKVGAVVGTLHTANEVLIEQCYVGENVYIGGEQKIGGITGGGAPTNSGKTVRVTIKNCYCLAEIDADKSGGIVGNLWSTYNRYNITGCYSNTRFSEGTSDLGSSTGNYAVQDKGGNFWTNISPENMIGAAAKNNMPDLDFDNIYMTTFDYPQLRVFYDYVVEIKVNSEENVGKGITADAKISDLSKPERLGYKFAGFYIDPNFTQKANDNDLVKNYTTLYVKLDQITSGDTVYNTFDQEGISFSKMEQSDKRDYQVDGKFLATRSNLTASNENGQFTQYDAWIEPGVGTNGSNGLKVIRAHGYEKQWTTAVMLYDFDGTSFVPEANSYYQISLKYKLPSLKKGKELKFRLREKVGGKVNVKYENVEEYGVINDKRIDTYGVSDKWQTVSFKFKAHENPQALYLAITTENNKYWAEELELYIDDIVIKKITEKEMEVKYESSDSLNTYDEKGINFIKVTQSDKRDYKVEGNFEASMSSMGIGTEKGQFTQYDAWIEPGEGVNGSNGIKVVRAQGYEVQWPTAVALYDSNEKEFTPKANSCYRIKLKYRLVNIKSGKKIKLRLRSTVGGKYNVKYASVHEYGVVNKREINNYTIREDTWIETSMNFETEDNPEPIFLAITTENNKYWAEDLEFYIDDIEIKEITPKEMDVPYESSDFINTYDEDEIKFTQISQSDKRDYQVEGKFEASMSSMGIGTEKGQFTQYDAWVEKNAGVNGSNAVKVVRAQGYEKQWPTAVCIYDKNLYEFTPKANSYYRIKLKYKLVNMKSGKKIKLHLRSKVDGKYNVKYENVHEYGVINERDINNYTISDAWVETSMNFETKNNPQPIFLAITTENNKYWAEDLELYIDDIEIKEIAKEEMSVPYISPDSTNTYDEGGITFTKVTQSDKRDYQVEGKFEASMSSMGIGTEKGQFTQYDAWVENGAGIGGSNAVKVVRAQGYEKQWPTAVCLYDSNRYEFTPKANSNYQIKLKYRLVNMNSGKKIELRLRSKVGGKYNVKYANVYEYGVINKRDINNYTISDAWVEASMNFETEDNPEPIFLAITTENNKWWAENLELYIDNIEIKEIAKEETEVTYVSPNSANTYDENGISFKKITQSDKRDYKVEGKFEASMSSMGIGTEKGQFSQYDAWVENGAGIGGSNALKIVRAQGYEKQWPTAVCLYDSNQNEFTPRANSYYQIKLKYKLSSLKKGKQIEIRLRQEVGGKYNVKYKSVVDYGRVNSTIIDYTDISDSWKETTFKFSTGSDVAPLFLAFTTENNKWWAEELELYVDEISIREISYSAMGYDEGKKGRVWSGKVAMNYAGGNGTEAEPWLIETPEQLAKCVNDALPEKKYYKLTADLKLNNTSSSDWTKNAKEWIYDTQNEKFFRGHINGDGHIISGMYYNSQIGDIRYAALFPQVKGEAVIEKLGIVDSSITIKDGQKEVYGAAFIGFVPSTKVNGKGTGPKLSQCFANDTVTVDSYFAGGLICGIASYGQSTLENCYFTGKLFGSSRSGTLFGNSWTETSNFSSIKNCYATSPDRDHVISNKGLKSTEFENVYIDSKADNPRPAGVEYSILKFMQGEKAKELMTGFDFNNIWKIVEDGTPVLRVFGSDKYSSRRSTEDVKISFIVNGGSSCEPIKGQPRSTLPELPVPTRYGYDFAGWYYFFDMYLPCDLRVFPDFNTVLYAKWVPKGFEIDFENNLDPKYDYNSAAVQHKPGTSGYLPKFNRNGMKSMHCMADNKVSPVFLLSYENSVEKGKEYEIVLRMKTDSAETVSGNVDLLFSEYPDITSELINTGSTVEFSNVGSDKWSEIKAKFVAGDEFIFLSTPKNMSLYFDDVQIVPTGSSGKVTVNELNNSDNSLIWIVAGAFGVLLLGGISAVIILKLKKKRIK